MLTAMLPANAGFELDVRLEKARHDFSNLEQIEVEETVKIELIKKIRLALMDFLELFERIQQLDDVWRRDIFRGAVPYTEETDQNIRRLYALWYSYSQTRKLTDLPNELGDCLRRLDEVAEKANEILIDWKPPALSRTYSVRARQLSPEAAARLKEIFPETK